MMTSKPPLAIEGPLLDTRNPIESQWEDPAGSVRVRLRVYSNIWLPRVKGFLEPEPFDPDERYDNSPLASRHTPRLNAFLRQVAEATSARGGAFHVHRDMTSAEPLDLTADGLIRLDSVGA